MYVSLNVTPVTGNVAEWKAQYSFTGQGGPWSTVLTSSPTLISNHGQPLSEISRFGTATSARTTAINLKYRPSTGGWIPWTNLSCFAYFPNSINDYDAQKTSNNSWQALPGVPPPGDC